MSKPFVKWAGGKRQLIDELIKRRPKRYKRYIEPFIGGGALFFELKPKNAFISDINKELINLYLVVRDNVEALIKDLRTHKNTPEYYYKIRNADRNKKYLKWSSIKKASRFIYLNKTCFNGLYRVNSKGQFNTPFGFYKNPPILDELNLRTCSKALETAEIEAADFDIVLSVAKKGELVYLDPPYVPLTATANFTSYTNGGFDLDMQLKLRDICDELDRKGVYWMLSNSDTKFVRDLYQHYDIHGVMAPRAINCNGNKRGKVKEVVVTNYEVRSE